MSGERQAVTIERTFRVLIELGKGQRGFAELSEALKCPAPTMSRLLKTLSAAGFVTGGGGSVYRITPQAQQMAVQIGGDFSTLSEIRSQLASLSARLGTGCAWFAIEPSGVRCLYRHLIPEGVGIIEEGAIREDLRGHGSVVAACAISERVCTWHAKALRYQLALSQAEWSSLLAQNAEQGYNLSYAMESVPGHGLQPMETLARLSVPILGKDGIVRVLSAAGHGLGAERVFPRDNIAHAQQVATRLAQLSDQVPT